MTNNRVIYMDSKEFNKCKDKFMNEHHKHNILPCNKGVTRHDYYSRNGRRMLIVFEIK